MKRREVLYNVSVTAYTLGATLGLGRQWVDSLNDFRGGRGDAFGEVLLPVGHVGGDPERCRGPRYRRADIERFIRAVRAASGSERPYPFASEEYEFDDTPGLDEMAWKIRRVKRCRRVPRPAST